MTREVSRRETRPPRLRWKMRSWLLALVLATALPCASVFVWLTGTNARRDREEAERDARAIAELIASRTDQKVEDARRLLEVLARRPKVRALRPGLCDELLPDLPSLQPEYAGVLTVDASGRLVCSADPSPQPISYVDRTWFHEAMRGRFFVSGPKLGRVSKRWIVPFSAPILDDAGRPIGGIVLSLDLLLLGPALEPRGGNGVRAAIFDLDGSLIARSVDGAHWMGRNFSHRSYVARAIASPAASFQDTDMSGELRVYGSAPAVRGQWRVLVSFSEAQILAPSRRSRSQAAAFGLAILAAAVALGYWLNLRMLRPIRGLSEAALAARDQGVARHAEVGGPEELRSAITHFNELMTARAEGENAVLQSGKRVAQLNRFLRTSWSVSKVIARASDGQAIVAGACDILVEVGGLRGAWAAIPGGQVEPLEPACSAGLDKDALAAALVTAPGEGSARLFREAMRTGERQVIDDLEAGASLVAERNALRLDDVRSVAAMPVFKGGSVVGALVVYARDPAAFDAEVLALLDELLREVGRGLEVLDEVASRKHAEAALRVSESRLLVADRLASLGRLSAGVAHEINNPLAYVAANTSYAREAVQRLASGAPDDAVPRAGLQEIGEALAEASEGVERVRLIVRDLKIFSRSETTTPSPVDLARVIASTAQIAGNEIRHRAKLVKAVDEDLPPVTGSESRLGQVFLNLLINAAQAIEPGAADRNQIRIAAHRVGARVVVEVSDTGSGIAPELQDRIFEPFFTTKPRGVGSGLGLSICHGIVSEMGAELTFESTPGQGSVFRVSLPIDAQAADPREQDASATAAADRDGAEAARGAPAGAEGTGGRTRVLIVDDEPAVGRAIARLLGAEHEVVCLTSARAALDWLRDGGRCDLLLCDIMMPEMTGIELHAVLEDRDPGLARQMIFITGGVFTPAAQSFLDRVPNRRAEKPFDQQRLRALVREAAARLEPRAPAA